ncbi:unnamed protein product [Lactuca virosa]|uniref:Leucine-rich repeat-containing N-terminal plant-type domain-containing protein n=1 Tax=Lactuca virosa TaxID=75947 RepID=A0AAU9PRQ5_9ASTR|nr:unnamed protein product [Lactuca virosa]
MYPYSSFLNSSSSIEFLSLKNYNLTSSMYRWLFPLTSNKLRFLSLFGNMLDGIPKYLGNPCSLESLDFYNNSFVVKFPDFLNNLSGCTSLTLRLFYAPKSQFTGSFSDVIQKFSSLKYLDLSYNHLNGTISEKLWELPRLEHLDVSFNFLGGAISKNIEKTKAIFIDPSRNSLQGVPSTHHLSSLFDVIYLDLSICKLGPRFPKWIQTMKNLTYLRYLNLSSNNLIGKVPNLVSNFDENSVIDLSSNSFYGPIPNVSSTLASLNLSRNKFCGGISFLCQIVDGFLEFLDLSDNFLTGQLLDCLRHFKQLKVRNLGHNNLFGRIPASIGSLIKLETLYLYKNDFSGEFLVTLKKCSSLNSLNLGANNFSGTVPVWVGENLSGLYILILRSNRFSRDIPLQLCQLTNLQILDLSRNNLHGTIPSCLNNLTSMVQNGFSPPPDVHPFSIEYVHSDRFVSPIIDEEYVDHAMIEWQGKLCGPPLTKKCLGNEETESTSVVGKSKSDGEDIYELERWFYICGATGFAIGFWIACGTLLFNRRVRHALFLFLDSFKDWVYVRVVVFIANWQRIAHA